MPNIDLLTIQAKIKDAIKTTPKPWVAAFDADGTLWNTDLGEIFFEYQIQNSGLQLPSNPWDYYDDLKKEEPAQAYLWLAQINKGVPLMQVRHWAEAAFLATQPFPFFTEQTALISFLKDLGFEIYVVTASVKWAVEPGAKRLGIPEQNVLGVETKVQSGIVSDILHGVVTYKTGKAEALLNATRHIRPILSVGNTIGDFHLLESASSLPIAVHSQKSGEPLFAAEQELQSLAQTKTWWSWEL